MRPSLIRGRETVARACWLLAVVWAGVGMGVVAHAQQATAAAAPGSRMCIMDSSSPSPAETALSKEDYNGAEGLFRGLLAKSADNESAHEGLVRTLIGQDKVAAAAKEAEAWAAAAPSSSMAWTALGDVRLRQGDPREALHQYQAAAKLDPCNARAYYGLAEVDFFVGLNETGKRLIEQAHALHPTDDDINVAWIETRLRQERLDKLADYAEHSDQISDADRTALKAQLKDAALYPGADCRMTPTSAHEVTVPLVQTIDGPLHYEGWGLDMQFNGKTRRVKLSTGASGITISADAAISLGFEGTSSLPTLAIDRDGVAKTTPGVVASIKIGGMEFTNCRVRILPKGAAARPEGLVGADIFNGSLLTLDFPKHELRLAPLPERPGQQDIEPAKLNSMGDEALDAQDVYVQEGFVAGRTAARERGKLFRAFEAQDAYVAPEMSKWFRIYRRGFELLIPTSVVDTSRMLDQKAWKDALFTLGTGIPENWISLTEAEGMTKLSPYASTRAGFVEDETTARETGKLTLAFAGLVVDSPSMTAVDLIRFSHRTGVEVSGVIGAPALTQLAVHIDYRDNLVWCEYAKSK